MNAADFVDHCADSVQQGRAARFNRGLFVVGPLELIRPDLIEAGVDIIHPIQALATGMEPNGLKNRYGSAVSFYGVVDAQYLLVYGSPVNIKALFDAVRGDG